MIKYILPLAAIDQITKYWIISRFELGESLPVAPFFQLTYVTNTGVAFSMFRSIDRANIYFSIFTAAVLAGIVIFLRKKADVLPVIAKYALTLVISGALGNLVDRVIHGHVIDFLDVFYKNYHWPVFNAADSFITIGGALLVINALTPSAPSLSKRV